VLSKSRLRLARPGRGWPPLAVIEITSERSFESDSGRWRGPVFESSRHLYLIIPKENLIVAGLKWLAPYMLKPAREGEDPCPKLKPIVRLPNGLKKPAPGSLSSGNHTAAIS
jgi:hypothetical protein